MTSRYPIGVIGGGQLARMMIPASISLGIDLKIFAERRDSSAYLASSTVGDYKVLDEVLMFSSKIEVLTLDHEHVPLSILRSVREKGTKVHPSPEALALTQNKITMRRNLAELRIPQPRWVVIGTDSVVDAPELVGEIGGFPCVAKKPIGGYDGKGVRVIDSLEECADWVVEGEVLLEELVPFTRELSQLSARRLSGQWSAWPVVETRQEGGVCSEVIAGAVAIDDSVSQNARDIAERIAHAVDVVGVLAVELFETPDGQILVNELAMRPHNSGHVLTELSVTSQFEQHLRAVADLPLGSTDFIAPFGVMANVFGDVSLTAQSLAWESFPEAKIHSYQKAPRPGRKAGHVVVVGSNLDTVLGQARGARDIVQGSG